MHANLSTLKAPERHEFRGLTSKWRKNGRTTGKNGRKERKGRGGKGEG